MKDKIIAMLILLIMIFILLFVGIICVSNDRVPSIANEFENCAPHDKEATMEEIDYWNNYQELQQQKQLKSEEQRRNHIMKMETTFPSMIKDLGVNYYAGYMQTWYSSRTLSHKNIGKWHTDSLGYWRDADGYIVIAYANGTPEGTIIPIGDDCWGRVLDVCEAGNIDLYVNW